MKIPFTATDAHVMTIVAYSP